MKKLFFSLVALMAATMSYAQSSLLATLSHDGNIQTFYGANALQQAHAAAQSGDVITLSEGSFNATNITKGITIRGAGMFLNDETKTYQTQLLGNFDINIADSTAQFTLEGIWYDGSINNKGFLKNPNFLKCRLKQLSLAYSSGQTAVNATLIHCRVGYLYLVTGVSSIQCFNCHLSEVEMYDLNQRGVFENCIIGVKNLSDNGRYIKYSILRNCIFYRNNTFSSSNSLFNCYFMESTGMQSGTPNIGCRTGLAYSYVFKTFTGAPFSDNSNFELTDEAATKLLGTDGTQAGIYGGNMPYSPVPTSPQITKCNVAAKSTVDGKLSVDITVKGAE